MNPLENLPDNNNEQLAEELQEIIDAVGIENFRAALLQTTFPETESGKTVNEQLRWVISKISASQKPALMADCIALASGIYEREGHTQTSIAAIHRVSRSAISASVLRIQETLDLPPTLNNKSLKARERYRVTNSRML
jgi:hypothetical protein